MDYKAFDDLQMKRYISNSVQDSDVEYEDETDESDSSDADNDDIDITISSDDLQNKNYLKYYNSLTPIQKQAYLRICSLFANKQGAVVTINTQSGTGKTFLLIALTKTFAKSVQFITFRRDQASEISLKLKDCAIAYTYISFYKNCFQLGYTRAIQLFNTSGADDIDLLYKLILYSRKYLNTGTKIIVVDSCTLPSATMLILLYILSLKHRIHLVFSGNKIQLSAIYKSSLHNRTNFDIIKILNDMTIKKLSDRRSFDKTLNNKLSQFRKMIQQNRPKNEVQFHFNLRYYLYCCFRSKYFAEEHFDVMYMAQSHQNITDRLNRFIDYLNASGRSYKIAPFYISKEDKMIPLPTNEKGKFFPGLILVEGYKYFHVDRNGVHSEVLLEKITPSVNNAFSLSIRFLHNNQTNEINICELNYYQVLPALRNSLVDFDEKLYQFPLRPYTLTYHAALGRTISNEKIELSADGSLANAIYVGLCCFRNYNDIKKIHAQGDLPSFVVTDYMRKERNDDKYYYRCLSTLQRNEEEEIMRYVHEKGPNNFIDSIEWTTVQSLKDFERKKLKSFTRILRSVYEKPSTKSKNTDETRLMKIADFIKNKPHVILDTMEKAPHKDIDQYNKTVKKPKYRKSDAYVLLKKEYTNWSECTAEE